VRGPRAGRFAGRFSASGGAKFTKMGDSLPWTPMKRRAKFDAAGFILGGEIRNRTNKQTNKQTHKLTVNDIYPRLVYRHVWINSNVRKKQTVKLWFLNVSIQHSTTTAAGFVGL